MLKILAALAALALPTAALAQAPEPEPVQVMVLAVPHLDNPGRDVHNARIDPVTTPQKQAELARIAEDLARFRPTAIAIESVAADPSTMIDDRFAAYTPDWLLSDADERVQIGYRLAAQAGVDRVYAVDQKDRPGEPSYFPYGDVVEWVQANGRSDEMQAWGQEVQAFLAEMEQRQRTETLGALLAAINAPGMKMSTDNGPMYYRYLAFGSGDDLPGAELNGRWYTRNARIFAKLTQVARPGDRIVLMFGAGHAWWLRHFVSTTPGYQLVEPTDWLSGR